MKIWVDADACPVVIKEILFKAAERTGVQLTLVANQPVRVPPSRFISSIQVTSGFDVADNEIVKRVESGDLVITGDIPLANDVLEKGGFALNPRGKGILPRISKPVLTSGTFLIPCGAVASIRAVHRR